METSQGAPEQNHQVTTIAQEPQPAPPHPAQPHVPHPQEQQVMSTEEVLRKPWFSGKNRVFVLLLAGFGFLIILGIVFMVIARISFSQIFG